MARERHTEIVEIATSLHWRCAALSIVPLETIELPELRSSRFPLLRAGLGIEIAGPPISLCGRIGRRGCVTQGRGHPRPLLTGHRVVGKRSRADKLVILQMVGCEYRQLRVTDPPRVTESYI